MKPVQVMRYRGTVAPPTAGTDDFNVNSLGNYTEYADTSANWAISGGFLTATNNSAQAVLTRNGVSFANGEISAVITEADDTGLVLRLQNNNNYYVAVIYDNSCPIPASRNSVIIYKRVGGSYSIVGARATIPLFTRGTPKNLAFSASGNALTVKVDGVTYISTTDSSLLGAGRCGPRVNGPSAHKFDSFTWP